VTGGLRLHIHGIRRKPGETMFEGARPETSNDILTELARLSETRSWEPGTTIVTEGDAADCMHLIHEGELRAFVAGDGGPVVELNTLRAGELFGELTLTGEPRAASVQVTTRARLTRVTLLPRLTRLTRAEAERVLAQRPELKIENQGSSS